MLLYGSVYGFDIGAGKVLWRRFVGFETQIQPIAFEDTEPLLLISDQRLNQLVCVRPANGSVLWSANYNAFGETEVENTTITNNLRFPGQYYDNETGLHYNWHRYYDPGTGRYLQPDALGPHRPATPPICP